MPEAVIIPPTNGAAKPVVEPPKETPDPKLQEQYAKMAAREKTTLAERQKLAADRQSFEADRTAFAKDKEESARLRTERDNAKKDPESYLKSIYGEQWFSHLSELALDKKPPPSLEVAALRDELEKVRKETADEKQARIDSDKERKAKEDREAAARFDSGIIEKVKAAPDKYKLIAKLNYHDQVPELIRTHWLDQVRKVEAGNMTSDEMKLLSAEEAAQMVEDHWTAQAKQAAEVLGLTSAQPLAQTPKPKAPEGTPRDGTLTNSLTASSAKAPVTAPRMTAEEAERERTKRAYAAFDAAKAAQRK